jgi:hypothetical protein
VGSTNFSVNNLILRQFGASLAWVLRTFIQCALKVKRMQHFARPSTFVPIQRFLGDVRVFGGCAIIALPNAYERGS